MTTSYYPIRGILDIMKSYIILFYLLWQLHGFLKSGTAITRNVRPPLFTERYNDYVL